MTKHPACSFLIKSLFIAAVQPHNHLIITHTHKHTNIHTHIRSSCEALERYNLFKQEGGRAGGREVGSCRRRVEELREDINRRLEKVQASRTAK